MRKIESQMCQAIQSNKNWKSGNTEVVTNGTTSNVYLHGNLIATVTDYDMTIFDGGWQSNTTKSRLNALCDYFCITGEGVFQKDFLWYVRKFVGKINGQNVFKTEDFVSGYNFAWQHFVLSSLHSDYNHENRINSNHRSFRSESYHRPDGF